MDVAIPSLRNGGKLSKNHYPAGFRLMWPGVKVTPVHICVIKPSAKMTLCYYREVVAWPDGLTATLNALLRELYWQSSIVGAQGILVLLSKDGSCWQSCMPSTMCLSVGLVRASSCADPESTIGHHRLATRLQD